MPEHVRGLWPLSLLLLACEPKHAPVDPESVPQTTACPGAEGLERVWNPASRDALAAALEQLPGEWPQQLLASLDARMPEHVQRWQASYAQACEREATAVMRCLDRRAWELDAVFSLVVEAPERTPALWAALERGVDDPRACEHETGDGPPELDPARGRELSSLPLLLDLHELDRVEPLLAELDGDPVLASTPDHALPLALARVSTELAGGRPEAAAEALARAATLAEQLDADAQLAVADARARLEALRVTPEATELAREQAIVLAREQADPWLLVDQLQELGRSRIERGQAAQAVPPLVEAIGLAGRVGGPDNPETAQLQTLLAEAQLALGQVEAAHDSLIQARDAFVTALGPDHPQTLATVEAVGRLFIAAGQLGDAQFAFLDLLEIYTELYGVKDWRTAKIKLELADSLMAMDQHESARTLYTEAFMPLAQELGPVHEDVVRTSIHLGIAELALGNLDAAEPHCTRGRDLAKGLASGEALADEAERCLAEIAAARKNSNKNKRSG